LRDGSTAIILAGGKSSRIGVDKGLIKLDGRLTMVERIIANLAGLFDEMLIVTNDRSLYEGFPAEVVEDLVESKGPLGGIYSGLSASSSDLNFVVACDMPFISADLVRYIIGKPKAYDVVIPEIDGKLEALFARYSRRALPTISSHLHRDRLCVQDILEELPTLRIASHEIERFDPERLTFFNINYREDFRKARDLYHRMNG
jgi:molybdopterin-guanine dinucleotide biosynthesis protein A